MARILIAGCGYVGGVLARRLLERGHTVYGLRRRTELLPDGVEPVPADLGLLNSLMELPLGLDYVACMASPDEFEASACHRIFVQAPRNLLAALQRQRQSPRRVIFVSSTSVYAQNGGEWVDEESATEPWNFNGRLLLEGEATLRECPFPAVILRSAGIYGPGRTRLLDRARAGAPLGPGAENRWANRIHRDDCAAALEHLLFLEKPQPVYLGVDCEPSREAEAAAWLARRLGLAAPRTSLLGLLNSHETSSKRCRNARLLASGFQFQYPTYREGHESILMHEFV